jgi:hypothetical protein
MLFQTDVPRAHACRYGWVRLSTQAFDQAAAQGINIFDHFLPLSVQTDAMRREVIVGGYHPSFDEIPEGSAIPEYRGVFVDGRVTPSWQRVPSLDIPPLRIHPRGGLSPSRSRH